MKKNKQPGTSKSTKDERALLFVEAFISNGGNATQAAIAAGYTPKSAGQQGSRMSKVPHILSMIKARQDELSTKYKLTTESVIAELDKIVHADLRTILNDDGSIKPPKDWPDGIAGAISGLEINELFEGVGKERMQIGFTKKIKLWDKGTALNMAMKHLGLLQDTLEVKVSIADVLKDARERASSGRKRS